MARTSQSEKNNVTPVAVVTGASRGIGAGIATALAEAGFGVALNYSSEHSAQTCIDLADELASAHGVKTQVYCADVSDFEAVKGMIEAIHSDFGRIDVLVNNAGINKDGLLARMTEDAFDQVIEVNLKGAFNCMRHVTPIMMKQRSGRIINISSVVGLYGNAGQVNYAASKAGIVGMTKSAAKELGGRGITVNAVAPGFIDTDMTRAMSEKAREGVVSHIALRDLGTVEDVAAAVSFLASKQARYITGQVLSVDGGLSL
ncbi:MAG: 3-oxoacyl-[acyl-carrier-protein] reductase [Eggerthellaceae bacterium]